MPSSYNAFEPGVTGMGLFALPVASYAGGAILFVSSVTGKDGKGRVTYPGGSSAVTGGSASNAPLTSPQFPLASIAYALTLCSAGRGDCIFVLPNHVETMAASLNLSVSNVSIIGLAKGASDARGRFKPTVVGATVNITGDSIVIANMIFDCAGVDTIVALVTSNANSPYFFNCSWVMTTATTGALLGLKITGGSGMLLEYASVNATTATSGSTPTNFILTATASHNRLIVRNSNIRGAFSAAPVSDSVAAPFLNLEFGPNNLVYQSTSTNVANIALQSTASTGMVFGNYLFNGRTSLPTAFISGTNTSALLENNNVSYAKAGGPFSATNVVPAAIT